MTFLKKMKIITLFVFLTGLLAIEGCAVKMKNNDETASFASTTVNKPVSEDVALNSDSDIIRDMVTKTAFNQEPINWLNPSTGNIGVVSLVDDNSNDNCRNFKTSREAFDGVALYQGEVCETSPGVWEIQNFAQVK